MSGDTMALRKRTNQVSPDTAVPVDPAGSVVYPQDVPPLPPGFEAEMRSLQREKSDRKRLEIIRRFALPITIKRSLRKTVLANPKKRFTGFGAWRHQQRLKWNKFKASWNGFTRRLEVWRNSFKVIEGNFGTGVVSYFTFLKWLFFLNVYIFVLMFVLIVLPVLIFPPRGYDEYVAGPSLANTTSSAPTLRADNCSTQYSVTVNATDYGQLVLDVLQGTGWMEKTILFHGFYEAKRYFMFTLFNFDFIYNMPLAYLSVTLTVFLISLVLMVRYTARGMRESMISSEDQFYKYSSMMFAGWDFSLETERAASLKQKSLYNELAGEIKEEIETTRRENRTCCKKFGIYIVRILVNLYVIGALGGSGYLISYTTLQSEMLTQQSEYADYNQFVKLLIEFIPSLTITVLNAIVPITFAIVKLEDYSKSLEINLTIIRTVFLRLASVAVLLATMYSQINCSDNNVNRDYCNVNVNNTCPELRCWETYVGQQIYKLVIMNFFVTVLIIIFVEFPRRLIVTKCSCKLAKLVGQQEFDLPKNVLDLLYTQVLCWLGMFFSPLVPGICLIELFIFFYMKKLTVLFNYIPSTQPYRASRSNLFFVAILIIAYFGCCFPVGYVIWSIEPSHGCGPFRIYSNDLEIWEISLATLPPTAQAIFQTVTSTTVFVLILLIIIMALYFTRQLSNAYKDMVNLMKEQLALESRDKQFLMNKVTELSGEKGQSLRQFRARSNGKQVAPPQQSYQDQQQSNLSVQQGLQTRESQEQPQSSPSQQI